MLVDIVEGMFRGVLKLIGAVAAEGICERGFFWVGRLFLLIITMGQYPNTNQIKQHQGRIMVVGVLVCVALVITVGINLS